MTINLEQVWMLVLFVAANFAIAALGSRLGERGHGSEVWFESLIKPPGFPSPYFFRRAWGLAAICTGVAGWIIWRAMASGGGITALVLYGFQLLLLATWQGETIGLRRLRWGLTVGWVLFAIVTLTMLAALPASAWAWVWLVPLWLLVANGLRLNTALHRLNPPLAPAPSQDEATWTGERAGGAFTEQSGGTLPPSEFRPLPDPRGPQGACALGREQREGVQKRAAVPPTSGPPPETSQTPRP